MRDTWSAKSGGDDVAIALMNIVDEIARRRHDVIEEVCERSLQLGVWGVSVYEDGAMLDPAVPYGQIHHHQRRYAG